MRYLVLLSCLWGPGRVVGERQCRSDIGARRPHYPPIVINTWPFTIATKAAWEIVQKGGKATAAVVAGCSACEQVQCDGTVGFGGSPDDKGDTSLDALLMDGDSMDVGAVANLRMTKDAIHTALLVLELTHHSILAGNEASAFATEFGLPFWDTLATNTSKAEFQEWKSSNCQPNFFKKGTVTPDPSLSCGPYVVKYSNMNSMTSESVMRSHDTISMIAVDKKGRSACGSSTNGLKHKIAGRVGDAAIPGGGCYADSRVGACAATGDGDIHVRFLPCYQAVENMRNGKSAQEATDDAMRRIVDKLGHQSDFQGAIVAYDIANGELGSTRIGNNFNFSFTYQTEEDGLQTVLVPQLVTSKVIIK